MEFLFAADVCKNVSSLSREACWTRIITALLSSTCMLVRMF